MPPSRRSRTLGALLGLHAGDAFGAPHEFLPHTEIKSRFPGQNADFPRTLTGGGILAWAPGAATDDTDLTRAVVLAYRDAILNGDDVVTKAAEHCLSWYRGDGWPGRQPGSKPKDIGGATRTGLLKFAKSRDTSSSGAGQGSAGNGSLMRCIATGLFQPDRERLVGESRRISEFTHDDKRCTTACAAYNVIVSELVVHGMSPEEAVSEGESVAYSLEGSSSGGPVHCAIKTGRTVSLEQLAAKGSRSSNNIGPCSGYVLDSLILAVAAVLDKRRLDEVLVDIIKVGMDTDTNAAIAGGLLGARDGHEAVLDEWKDKMQFTSEFSNLAEQLLTAQGVISTE